MLSPIEWSLTLSHLMSRATNNGWEDSSGSVISSESSLAHAGAIVNHQGSNVFITHVEWFLSKIPDTTPEARILILTDLTEVS